VSGGQLNLLAPPSDDPVAVPICRSVLYAGSMAHAPGNPDEPLFAHRHVPPVPPKLPDDAAWLCALDFAEEELRFKQAGRAVFDLDRCSGTGCCGGRTGPSSPMVTSSSRGIEVDGILATWPQLLRGRREQREVELGLARARDLAEAYRYLDYYGRVYGEPEDRDGFDGIGEQISPALIIRRLAEEAIELGGDPTKLAPHTSYMRQGITEATR
jgi:hypothetical protein